MNKIDLHIHTKGDLARDISNGNLLTKLLEANVKLASITDHNEFDEEKFALLSANKSGINFIPGIEVDVLFKTERKHVIVYSNFGERVKLKEFEIATSKNPISDVKFYEIIKSFKGEVLISPHFMKDKENSFVEIDDVDAFFKELTTHGTAIKFMLETPKLKQIFDSSDHVQRKYHISWFSDLKKWDDYKEIELPLIPENIEMTNLGHYINIFVNTKCNMFFDNPLTFEKYILMNDKENKKIEFELSKNRLNIIFGSKGSGKSEIIKMIQNAPKESGKSYAWDTIVFGEKLKVDTIKELYKHFTKYKVFSSNTVSKTSGELNELFDFEEISSSRIIFNNEVFSSRIENYNASKQSEVLKKDLKLFAYGVIDNTELNEQSFLNHKTISESLDVILEIVSRDDYKGSINKDEIINLVKKNILDWRNGICFNAHSFIKNLNEKISSAFKTVSIPSISFAEHVNLLIERSKKLLEFKNKIDVLIIKNEVLLKSNLLGEPGYSFGYYVDFRNGAKDVNFDYIGTTSLSSNDIHTIKKMTSLNNLYEFLNFEFKLEGSSSKIPFKDFLNIFFYSKEGSIDFMPSTGQCDMLLLEASLNKNKNLIIDEFCNTLDNEYVFNKLIPILNKYEGTIIASTHNPLIAILPSIGSYIYRKKEKSGVYKTYISKSSTLTKLIDVEDSTKNIDVVNELVKVIEGTRKAFDERKEKYAITD